MQVEFKAKAYLPSYTSLESVLKGVSLPMITACDEGSYFEKEGYPLIGDVTLIVTMHSRDKIVQAQIESLNAQLQSERAESQRRQNAILDKISKLQALEFTPA